jgi:hypothetical protein
MIKKILVGVFVIGIVAAIVSGIVELVNPSEHAFAQQERGARQSVAQQGNGGQQNSGGRGHNEQPGAPNTADGESGSTGYGRGRQNMDVNTEPNSPGYGRGQNQDSQQPSRAEPQIGQGEWQTIEGTVAETAELVIETTDGTSVQVGLGPNNYRDSQGFILNVGDSVRVSGYWESGQEDEFKATQVENLSTGTQIVLRDASGRPMWAGQGRRSGQNNNF